MSIDREKYMVYSDALNKSLEIFVSFTEKAIDEVMTKGLWTIADAAEIDRVIVFRIFGLNSETAGEIYRWDRTEGGTVPIDPSLMVLPMTETIKRWISTIKNDTCISLKRSEFTEEEASFLGPRGVKSILITPVFIENEFWGVVTFHDNTKEREFDEECISLLHSAARLCAAAITKDKMKSKVTEEIEFNRVMFESAPIGLTIFNEYLQLVDCNDAILKMYGVTKEYYLEHFLEFSPEYQPDGIKTTDKLPDIMTRTLNGEKMTLEWIHQTQSGESIPCELVLTRVKYKNKSIGLGYIYDLRNMKKMQQMEKSIQLLEIEVAKINYDSLTGIYNRRYFDETMKRILKTLSRSENSILSIMMIDIDFFKNYNDTYGHNEGDNCLKAVAEVLSNCITRADDFVARYGGEEFVVVLPNTNKKGVQILASRLLENMRTRNIPHSNSVAADCVTFSIGATSGKVEYTYTKEDFIQRADELLYKSKQSGRNKYTYEDFKPPKKR